MRLFTSVLASAAMLFVASTASALDFVAITSVDTGHALNALQIGDVVTIDIRMANPAGVQLFGVGAGVQGWNQSVATFQGGEVNAGPYFCTGAATACSAGLTNGATFLTPPDDNTGNTVIIPGDVQNIAGVGNYFPIVQSVSTTGRSGLGAKDPGLDGVINGGDAEFRVVFVMTGLGSTTIDIGTNDNPILGNVVALAGGASTLANNALITLTVPVPEPGTALLMGLGLAGLAAAGRRQ